MSETKQKNGMILGILETVFAIAGILTIGIIFLPIFLLLSIIGLVVAKKS